MGSYTRLPRAGSRFALQICLSNKSERCAFLELGNYLDKFETEIEVITNRNWALLRNFRVVESFDREQLMNLGTLKKSRLVHSISPLKSKLEIDGYYGILTDFRDAIRDGRPATAKLAESIPVYKIIDSIRKEIGFKEEL